MDGQLREYFRAKRLRDKKIGDQAKKIAFNNNLSQEEKDARIRRLRMPCKKCKVDASLVFARNGRDLSITCTSGNSKCNKIVSRGAFAPISRLQDDARKRIEQLQTTIVQLRLEQVHGLIREDAAVAAFEATSAELAAEEATLEKLHTVYAERTRIPERKGKSRELATQLQSDVMAIREDIRTWERTNESDALRAAVQRYGSVIQPLSTELRDTKYSEAFTTKFGDEVILVERSTTMEQNQVSLSE
jgi:hypothetical protein